MAYSEDELGNTGIDETPPTINIVQLDYNIAFVDGEMETIEDFDVNFIGNRRKGLKVLPSPSTFFEVITITNIGSTTTLPETILNVIIPQETMFLGPNKDAFTLLGKGGVKVNLNGIDVTPDGSWINLESLNTGQALTPGDTIEIYIHLQYAFKGERYDSTLVSTWLGEEYMFETDLTSAYGPSWTCGFSCIPHIR